jgi:GT2 family glycosyltransferase
MPESKMSPAVSFVILTWNSGKTIGGCLESIARTLENSSLAYEIFLIDNGSSDDTIEIVDNISKKIDIDIIELGSNKGTTFPRNIGLRKSSGDIVCILDSDTVLINVNLRRIQSFLDDDTVGIVAPKLVLADGSVQNSVKKFPALFHKLVKIPKIITKTKGRDRDYYLDFPFQNVRSVDMAISACWFLKRNLLDQVGMLDEKIFYSPEDVDFCLRVRKAGRRIVYYPHAEVLHYTQQITHKAVISRLSLSFLIDLIYYHLKHRYLLAPKIQGSTEGNLRSRVEKNGTV